MKPQTGIHEETAASDANMESATRGALKTWVAAWATLAALAALAAIPSRAAAEAEAKAQGGQVYAIKIDTDRHSRDMIDRHHHYIIHRKLSEAEAAGARAFAIDLNTNGGRLDAAMMINDRLLHAQIPVYVYVNTRAISAGAMIAVSADHVGVHPGAAIGAALPVVPAAPGEGPSSQAFKAADSKVVSVLAAQMRAAAEAKGHPQDIAAAMVDPDKPVAGYGAPGEPLTLTAQEALKAGLAEVEADTFESFLEKMGLGDAQIVRPELTLAERAAAQLSRPLFASMLIGLAFILLIIEAKTPGVGLPLAGSIVCFALAQYGSLMADLSGWLEPALLMVGLTLLAIEIFITPGFGLLGLTGIGCIFTGIAFSMSNMPMSAAGIMQHWIGPSVYAILGSLVAAMVGLPVVLKILPHIPYLNGLALEAPEDDRLAQPLPDRLEALKVGMLGVADTDCRPSGSARFGEQRFDVLSEGRFIRKGTFVAIKEISGSRVVVAPKSLDAI